MTNRMQTLVDQLQIRQVLVNHSRGIDHCDSFLHDDAYSPVGHVDYGFFTGNSRDCAKTVTGLMHGGAVTMHRTSNQWIKLPGDAAVAESYVFAYMTTHEGQGTPVQTLIGGRYLDRLARETGAGRSGTAAI